jgi:sugar phosphate isomerase/epimerase
VKLGLLTAAFPDTPLTNVADWAGANGFSMLEGDLAERGIEISGLGYYPNPLTPDLDHRAEIIAHLQTNGRVGTT